MIYVPSGCLTAKSIVVVVVCFVFTKDLATNIFMVATQRAQGPGGVTSVSR